MYIRDVSVEHGVFPRLELGHNTDASPMAGRVTFAVVSLASIALLVACFAIRVKHLHLHNIKRMNMSRALVIAIYLCGIFFIASASLLQFGATISTISRCKSAIIMCLVFYVGGKVLMYVFLCERMHAIRRNYLTRLQDHIWVMAIVVVIIGFGVIACLSFVYPVFDISKKDGRCRIGLPFKITLPLLIYDILVNSSLTIVFFWLVRPFMRKGMPSFAPACARRFHVAYRRWRANDEEAGVVEAQPNSLDQRGVVERVAWKSLAACVAVLCSTVANLSVLFYMHGYEQSWLCFTLCTIDVSWGALVVHQLTHDPNEVDSGHPGTASHPVNQFPVTNLTSRRRSGADYILDPFPGRKQGDRRQENSTSSGP
ncbi:MAG: hypothetical protein M1814_002803 [Vezdaea aestivalis]|nr:MAG: hypothetical protein M1814_002803 [Vezdaea aestivalis]